MRKIKVLWRETDEGKKKRSANTWKSVEYSRGSRIVHRGNQGVELLREEKKGRSRKDTVDDHDIWIKRRLRKQQC